MADDLRTTELRDLLGPVAAGDRAARDELLRRVAGNLERLTRKMLGNYPTVRRWEETADVAQNVTLRLLRALEHVSPGDPRQFFGLAAEQIRRELIDLARHYYGAHGLGAHHASRAGADPEAAAPGTDADGLADWQEFHEGVARLSEADREVFDLLYYQGLSQAEAAGLLGLTVAAVQQRWQRARLRLHDMLQERGRDPRV
jgi:RNA polymerase sigma-70 factor (ECF subfamily)